VKFCTKLYLNLSSKTSIKETKQIIRERKNKSFANLIFFRLELFLFLLFPRKSITKLRTQLNSMLSNVLFLVIYRKSFLEKMVCSRTKFQKCIRNWQTQFSILCLARDRKPIELLMLQLDREEQLSLTETNQIWSKNLSFWSSYGTFIESTSIQIRFTVNFYFLWSILLSL
jgi:GTPase SAR1 family protein